MRDKYLQDRIRNNILKPIKNIGILTTQSKAVINMKLVEIYKTIMSNLCVSTKIHKIKNY